MFCGQGKSTYRNNNKYFRLKEKKEYETFRICREI